MQNVLKEKLHKRSEGLRWQPAFLPSSATSAGELGTVFTARLAAGSSGVLCVELRYLFPPPPRPCLFEQNKRKPAAWFCFVLFVVSSKVFHTAEHELFVMFL